MKVSLHQHRITRVLVAGLAAAALAAPSASAVPAPADRVDSGEPFVIEAEPAPVVQSVDTGFDWDSAAIGAGGAGALLLLVSVGGFTYRSRHDQHLGVRG